MTNELTAHQAETISEALSRLQKLLHYADGEMKSATLEHINTNLLHSPPGVIGTFLGQAVNSLKGSIAAKILRDAIRPVLQLREYVPGDRDKSLKTLRAVVASLEEIAEQTKKHSLRDDANILALAEALRTGKDFSSAAAFCRAFLKERPHCGATQKSLETMLGRECSIWKKQKTKP